jgi:hypothetical protein
MPQPIVVPWLRPIKVGRCRYDQCTTELILASY